MCKYTIYIRYIDIIAQKKSRYGPPVAVRPVSGRFVRIPGGKAAGVFFTSLFAIKGIPLRF